MAENEEKQEEKADIRVFRSLKPYLVKYRWHYFGGILCVVFVDGAQMVIPQFIRRAINLIALGDFLLRDIIILALGAVGTMALIAGGRFLWRYFLHGASRRIEMELREKFFRHLMTLSYEFYQQNKIGDLMARAINDLGAVRQAIGMGLVTMIDGVVMVAAILAIIFVQDPRTAAFSVIPLPLITLLILLFGKMVGRKFFRTQETYSNMSDTVQETFAGVRVVKSFVKETWFIKKFADTNEDYQAANMVLVKIFSFFFPFIAFLSGLTALILLLVGGGRVLDGSMGTGDLVALFSYLQMLIWPLMGAGFMVNMIQRGAVSLARINEVLDTKPGILSPETPRQPGKKAAANIIEIRNLSFAYPGGEPVLRDINLSIERGSLLGILGRTGSGKSTLIKTLVRMVDPPPGAVFVEGLAVGDWDLAELRGRFGVTPQDSYLFSDSIKRNIGYGLESPAEEQLHRAVSLSAIDQDLKAFVQGWDTMIGERGLTLSGGQKQRVAISRALVCEPDILVLDDSLSAVDAETERRILDGLLEEMRNKTGIIISHRVSTLRYADKVAVLDQGRITEYGSPAELIARGGFFAKTAALQQLDQNKVAGEAANG
ncbi:MAG: ABC transporter ATP-binding protein/permease [Treponema sp.]|jgi:ATP-binding cassette subfamily B protein|nr:ABC transporter ATP-binding protein/permease [Treponema sp.]